MCAQMKLTVEFMGPPRRLAQCKSSLVTVPDQATLRDVLRQIGERFPALVGPVIVPETHDLVSAYMLNIDGKRAVQDLDLPAEEDQRLYLMFLEAGG